MKIKRLIALMLVIITLISTVSCNKNKHNGDVDGNLPTDSSQNQQQGGEGNVTFYYSVNSDKFHIAGCYHLYSIEKKFMKTSMNASELISDGYAPCRDCIVQQSATEEEDNSNKIAKEDATFVIGTGNNKLHTLDCHNVKKIQEKNLEYTDLTIDELMEIDKYAPCKDCLPDEAKIYYEKHPEKDPSNKN